MLLHSHCVVVVAVTAALNCPLLSLLVVFDTVPWCRSFMHLLLLLFDEQLSAHIMRADAVRALLNKIEQMCCTRNGFDRKMPVMIHRFDLIRTVITCHYCTLISHVIEKTLKSSFVCIFHVFAITASENMNKIVVWMHVSNRQSYGATLTLSPLRSTRN